MNTLQFVSLVMLFCFIPFQFYTAYWFITKLNEPMYGALVALVGVGTFLLCLIGYFSSREKKKIVKIVATSSEGYDC